MTDAPTPDVPRIADEQMTADERMDMMEQYLIDTRMRMDAHHIDIGCLVRDNVRFRKAINSLLILVIGSLGINVLMLMRIVGII